MLGAAGAALAGSQYEKDRKQQSQDSDWRYDRRYHRTDRSGGYGYVGRGGYGRRVGRVVGRRRDDRPFGAGERRAFGAPLLAVSPQRARTRPR